MYEILAKMKKLTLFSKTILFKSDNFVQKSKFLYEIVAATNHLKLLPKMTILFKNCKKSLIEKQILLKNKNER